MNSDSNSDWNLYYSDEGYPYYLNLLTNESVWAEVDSSEFVENISNDSPYTNDGILPYKLYPVAHDTEETEQYKESQSSAEPYSKCNHGENISFDSYIESDEGKRSFQREIFPKENKFQRKSSTKKEFKSYYTAKSYYDNDIHLDSHTRKQSLNDPYNAKIRPSKKLLLKGAHTSHNENYVEKSKHFEKHKKQNFRYTDDSSDSEDTDIESIISENDPDFQEYLKEEFSFDSKWKDWYHTISSYGAFILGDSRSSKSSNSRIPSSSAINPDYKQQIATKGLSLLLNLCFFFASCLVSVLGIVTNHIFNIDWKSVLDFLDGLDIQVKEWIKTIDNPASIKNVIDKKSTCSVSEWASASCNTLHSNGWNQTSQWKNNSSVSLYDSDPKTATSPRKMYQIPSAVAAGNGTAAQGGRSPNKKVTVTKYRECIDDCDLEESVNVENEMSHLCFVDV